MEFLINKYAFFRLLLDIYPRPVQLSGSDWAVSTVSQHQHWTRPAKESPSLLGWFSVSAVANLARAGRWKGENVASRDVQRLIVHFTLCALEE